MLFINSKTNNLQLIYFVFSVISSQFLYLVLFYCPQLHNNNVTYSYNPEEGGKIFKNVFGFNVLIEAR